MRTKKGKKIVKYVAIICAVLFLMLLTFPSKKSASLKKAEADSLNAYPSVCLGGWQNPSNAAGQPDVPAGSDSFSETNSAVLNQTDAQIFCGNFQSADQSQTPSMVTLHFSWKAVFSASSSVGTDTDAQAWTNVLDTTSTATSTDNGTDDTNGSSTASAPQAPAPTISSSTVPSSTDSSVTGNPVTTSTDSGTDNAVVAPSDSGAANTDSSPADDSSASDDSSNGAGVVAPAPAATAPAPDPTSASAPAAPTSDQSDPSQGGTSLLQGIIKNPFAFLVQKTFADTISGTNDPTSFLDVSYSLDGSTWQDLSQVDTGNWQNFSVTIPVSSWDDINKLQVQLNPLPSLNAPTIYLDNMWLEVDYGQTLSGTLQEGANAALGAISDLSDAVNGALDSAATDLTDAADSLLSPVATSTDPALSDDNPAPAPAPSVAQAPTPPVMPVHQYSFSLQNSMPVAVQDLSWISADYIKSYDADVIAGGRALPSVVLDDQNTVQISGKCTEKYYTVLLFSGQDDYKKDPSLALFNRASPCVNGQFTETIADTQFPSQLTDGTYYLMVADQNQKGPWEPHPALYPISVTVLNPSSGQ